MLLPFQIAVELQVVGELSFIFALCLELLPSSQASLVSCNRPCIPPQHGVRGRNVTFFQVVWVHCCYLVSSRPQCRSEKQILRSIVSAFCFVLKVGDECKPKPQRHGTVVARARTLNTSRQTRHKRRTTHTHAVQLNTRNALYIPPERIRNSNQKKIKIPAYRQKPVGTLGRPESLERVQMSCEIRTIFYLFCIFVPLRSGYGKVLYDGYPFKSSIPEPTRKATGTSQQFKVP